MASNNLALILLTLTPILFLLAPQTGVQGLTSQTQQIIESNTTTQGLTNETQQITVSQSQNQINITIQSPTNETQQIIESQLNTTTQGFTTTLPAPHTGAANLTATLLSGGQYNTFLRLLNETHQIIQIQSQLNTGTLGFTVLAPTDNAFQTLPSGVINGLTFNEKVKLLLYHIIPHHYTLIDLLTVSNPVSTEAAWGLNFTGHGNQVNVSTGVVETAVNNALREQFPLAVYGVDKVLLPLALFGTNSPKSEPSPNSASSPKSSSTSPKIPSPATTVDAADAPSQSKNGAAGMNVRLGMVVGLGFICMGAMS